MAVDVLMPQLGLTMKEGLIMEWKKKQGEPVRRGEILFSVENDKATIDVEAQADGILAERLVEEMVTVPVGTVVGKIAAAGEKIPVAEAASAGTSELSNAPEDRREARPPSPGFSAASGEKGGFRLASPLARKMAASYAIDLADVRGTGPMGAVVARDLPKEALLAEQAALTRAALGAAPAAGRRSGAAAAPAGNTRSKAAGAAPAAAVGYRDIRQSRIQAIAAERMTESWTSIPQFTLYGEADAEALLRLTEQFKKEGKPVSLTAIAAKLLAHAALDFPLVNAMWVEPGIVRTFDQVNVNVAVDTEDGLAVPVLRACPGKGFAALGSELKDLAERAKAKALAPEDYEGGTITLSNLGMFGIRRFRAIVNPPQTAILALGGIAEQALVRNGALAAGKVMEFSVTADHRVVDGAYAARFMARLKALFENPLLILG